jgi:hypothetical protein
MQAGGPPQLGEVPMLEVTELTKMDILTAILPVLTTAVVGAVLKPFMDGLEKIWAWLELQRPWVKRVVLVLAACIAAVLSKMVGIPLPPDLFHVDGTVWGTILMAFAGHYTHKLVHKPTDV